MLFDNWLAGKSKIKANHWQKKLMDSGAIVKAADEMNKLLIQAEGYSGTLPRECKVIIAPIQSQLRHVCEQIGAA